MGMAEVVRQRFADSIAVKQAACEQCCHEISEIVAEIVCCLRDGKKVIFAGNGGSAADSQHLAAEFTGRFMIERVPLPAMALNTNSSAVTAIGNDYGYDQVFLRQTQAFAQPGDVFVGISTSGNSECITKAAEYAREHGCFTVGMTGEAGGQLAEVCHTTLKVPSRQTPRIQETHILMGHIICELVEQEMFAHVSV